MQDELFRIIKDNLGSEFQRPATSTYNIFPKHIPNGAVDNTFSSALFYNIISNQVNHTQSLYTVQLTVVNLNYSECRRIAVLLKNLFNKKDFMNEPNSFLTTTVSDMQELPFNIDDGLYATAVNIVIKTGLDW
jgi:hypothetical protein